MEDTITESYTKKYLLTYWYDGQYTYHELLASSIELAEMSGQQYLVDRGLADVIKREEWRVDRWDR